MKAMAVSYPNEIADHSPRRGAKFAHDYLGYSPAELMGLPHQIVSEFAGVGNPLQVAPLERGERVLDHACGAGTDLLLAAQGVGADGHVIGVEASAPMRELALQGVHELRLTSTVDVRAGWVDSFPVKDESVDVVISNGVIDLAADPYGVFTEIARVLRPGGRLFLAAVVVRHDPKLAALRNPAYWAVRTAGAAERRLALLASAVGLQGGQVVDRFDCFDDRADLTAIATKSGFRSVNFIAWK